MDSHNKDNNDQRFTEVEEKARFVKSVCVQCRK